MIQTNGVELCVDTFGSPDDPAILLIGGAAASMDWWEEDFCRRLAGGGRYVVRYDTRDTGQSTSFDAGAPTYTQADLLDDAIGLLDALGIDRAHVVGISMGGGIAQRLAVEQPSRIHTLTLMSTSPGGSGLPPMAERIAALFTEPAPDPDWTDREAVIESTVTAERTFAGSLPVDEARIRAIAGRSYDRTVDVAASRTNHWIIDGGTPIRDRLGSVRAPTLILHGTEDPLFPLGHAEALAREIRGARLTPIEGMGHQMPPPGTWSVVIPAILEHTSGRSRRYPSQDSTTA